MELNVQIDGLQRISNATEQVRQEIANELAKGMLVSMKRVEGDAKRSILGGGKTGRTYRRGKSVVHRASAPGEAPASDTGLLANSIRGELDGTALKDGSLEGTVSVGVSYGRPLEFGTSTIAARPFLQPALEKNRVWIRERLNQALRDALIRVTKGK